MAGGDAACRGELEPKPKLNPKLELLFGFDGVVVPVLVRDGEPVPGPFALPSGLCLDVDDDIDARDEVEDVDEILFFSLKVPLCSLAAPAF